MHRRTFERLLGRYREAYDSFQGSMGVHLDNQREWLEKNRSPAGVPEGYNYDGGGSDELQGGGGTASDDYFWGGDEDDYAFAPGVSTISTACSALTSCTAKPTPMSYKAAMVTPPSGVPLAKRYRGRRRHLRSAEAELDR